MFKNKRIIVVGVDMPSCAELMFEIARQGVAELLLLGRNQARIDEVCQRAQALGVRATTRKCDFVNFTSFALLAKELREEFGQFDFLINGTGNTWVELLPAQTKIRMQSEGAYAVAWVTEQQPLNARQGLDLCV